MAVANRIAYGRDKHVSVDYWRELYEKDPPYTWKRLLGWQAGSDDVARYGRYAVPASPWHDDPAVPLPPGAPLPGVPAPATLAELSATLARQADLLAKAADQINSLRADVKEQQLRLETLRTTQQQGLVGTLWGMHVKLTPP